jgi:hypothetical protein
MTVPIPEALSIRTGPAWLGKALALPAFLVLSSGCATVTGRIQPTHFQFATIVAKRGTGPGGWRAACVHAKIKNGTTGEFFFCKFGVELPIENERDGPISLPLAQRVAAECANEVAYAVLETASREPDPPLGLLCESFKTAYGVRLSAAIAGAQVTRVCDAKTKPVVFGEFTPSFNEDFSRTTVGHRSELLGLEQRVPPQARDKSREDETSRVVEEGA